MILNGERSMRLITVSAALGLFLLGQSTAFANSEFTGASYEFSLIRAFANKVTIKVTPGPGGAALVASVDNEPDKSRSAQLDEKQTADLLAKIEGSGFWTMKSTWPCTGCRVSVVTCFDVLFFTIAAG